MASRAEFIYDDIWEPARLREARPDVVLCVNDWPSGIARCLDAARDAGIPSLVLQDGILEWRCQYENPLFGAGGGAPQHQPVLADRIACIGRQSARQIAAWGNAGRVEATGMPRMDHLLSREVKPRRVPGKCILVMTAKKAGFTEEQSAVTLRSLRDVRTHLETLSGVEVIWRVSGEMAEALGVANAMRETSSVELADVVERSDAVITTLSTAILESMLLDRPVAALDYHNVPRFVPTAWSISAPEHIAPAVAGILSPDARRMVFQRNCLRDCLECDGPAAPRVAALIERIATNAVPHDAAAGGVAEARVVESRTSGSYDIGSIPSLADLYPDQPVFAELDVERLQVRLARAEKDRERLERALRHRSVAQRLYALGRALVGNSKGGRSH